MAHRSYGIIAALSVLAAACAQPAAPRQPVRAPVNTYVIVHGAWGGSYSWRTVESMLTARGHRVHRVALTGQGARVHLATPQVGLETHINDVANHVRWEELRDVTLIGHSYGGMVITGAADRLADRVRGLVYVDAMVPDSGETVLSIMPESFVEMVRTSTRDGMIHPRWMRAADPIPKDVPQPLKTFTDTLHYDKARVATIPATYIFTSEPTALPDAFQRFADRARERGWPVVHMQANHVPNVSAPRELVELLLQIK